MKTYAGIGSRETPNEILAVMQTLAYTLSGDDWKLRSGGADGADTAFADGAWAAYFAWGRRPKPEVYLPWVGFNDIRPVSAKLSEPQPEAFPIAAKFHPYWESMSSAVRKLHARNVHQILGPDVTNPVLSRFVLCWTKGGAGGGGTGQAIRIANHFSIPVFDLAIPEVYDRVTEGVFA